MNHFTLLFFLLFTSSVIASSSNKVKLLTSSVTPEQVLQNKKVRFTHKEKKLNNKIEIFYDQFTKGKTNRKLLSDIIHSSKGRGYLKQFRYWLKDLEYVVVSNNLERTINHCERLNAEKYGFDSLFDKLNRYCARKVSIQVKKKKDALKKPQVFLYITKNLDLFLHHKNINLFTNALKSLEEEDNKKISNHISQYHISNNFYVDKKLLEGIVITPELTRYIQEKGFRSNFISQSFYKGFYEMTRDLYKSAEKREPARKLKDQIYKVLNYIELNKSNLPMHKVEERILSVAKSLSRRSYYYETRLMMSVLLDSKDSVMVQKGHFESLWTFLEPRKRRDAYAYIIENDLTKEFKNLKNSQLRFWIANTIEQKNKSLSVPYYRDIVLKDPVSYYGVMSAQEIAHIEDTSAEKIYRNLHANRVETPLISKKWTEDHLYNSLKRIKLFGGMNSPILIREEVRSLQDQKQIDGQTTTTLVSKSLLAAERYLDSFKIVYKSLAKSDFVFDLETLKSLFPMPYYKAVKKYTKNFDPLITLSLIRQESGFNPRARSHVGARGLMQLMPATARQFRKRVRAKSLEKPNLNLNIGISYLKKLLTRYDQNLIFALASYNAGEGNIDEWIREDFFRADNALELG
jgi:soluble lytic murein transglycosylase